MVDSQRKHADLLASPERGTKLGTAAGAASATLSTKASRTPGGCAGGIVTRSAPLDVRSQRSASGSV